MTRQSRQARRPQDALTESYDNMMSVDGKRKKLWCPDCGGPRDPELAERIPCFCCGSLGTQKRQPQFDELGDPLTEVQVRERRQSKTKQEEETFDTPLVVRVLGAPPVVAEQPKPAAVKTLVKAALLHGATKKAVQPPTPGIPTPKPDIAASRRMFRAARREVLE